mmetsp:Transcript_2809/g.6032  ORF Transcript_2809/g.6032 Transcript_2809/m.6032 type:complete len:205 (-) Transcript_2809:2108-2722(-)
MIRLVRVPGIRRLRPIFCPRLTKAAAAAAIVLVVPILVATMNLYFAATKSRATISTKLPTMITAAPAWSICPRCPSYPITLPLSPGITAAAHYSIFWTTMPMPMPIVVLIISVTTMSLLPPLLLMQREKQILLLLPPGRSSRDLHLDLLVPTRIIILAGNSSSILLLLPSIPSISLPPLCLLLMTTATLTATATLTTTVNDATP